jgi:hypothetical protein
MDQWDEHSKHENKKTPIEHKVKVRLSNVGTI